MNATDAWYLVRDNASVGPMTRADLEGMIRSGAVGAEMLVWPGYGDWIPVRQSVLGGWFASAPAPAWGGIPGRPSVIELARRNRMLFRRFAASFVDFFVMYGILVGAELALGPDTYRSMLAVWVILVVAYEPVLEGISGRTLGRMVTDTIVVDANGNPPGIPKAIVRTVTRWIEVYLLPIIAGLVMLSSPDHQRLGDKLAGTYVVRRSELGG